MDPTPSTSLLQDLEGGVWLVVQIFFFLLSFGLFLSCFVKIELGCCPVWSLWFTGHVGIGYQLDSSVQAKCSMMCFFVVC